MARISQTSLPRSTPDILIPGVPCAPSVVASDWVYLDFSEIAQKAIATSLDSANVFGLVEETDGFICTIRVSGVSKNLFIGLDTTKEYLLSDAVPGSMTMQGISVPSLPGRVVLVLGKPYNASRFLVRVGPRIVRS